MSESSVLLNGWMRMAAPLPRDAELQPSAETSRVDLRRLDWAIGLSEETMTVAVHCSLIDLRVEGLGSPP